MHTKLEQTALACLVQGPQMQVYIMTLTALLTHVAKVNVVSLLTLLCLAIAGRGRATPRVPNHKLLQARLCLHSCLTAVFCDATVNAHQAMHPIHGFMIDKPHDPASLLGDVCFAVCLYTIEDEYLSTACIMFWSLHSHCLKLKFTGLLFLEIYIKLMHVWPRASSQGLAI